MRLRPKTRVLANHLTTVKLLLIISSVKVVLASSLQPGQDRIRTKSSPLVLLQAAPIKLAVAMQRQPLTFPQLDNPPILPPIMSKTNSAINLTNTLKASSLSQVQSQCATKTPRCCLHHSSQLQSWPTRWVQWRFWLFSKLSWPACAWLQLLTRCQILLRCINQVLVRNSRRIIVQSLLRVRRQPPSVVGVALGRIQPAGAASMRGDSLYRQRLPV